MKDDRRMEKNKKWVIKKSIIEKRLFEERMIK